MNMEEKDIFLNAYLRNYYTNKITEYFKYNTIYIFSIRLFLKKIIYVSI